MVEMGSVWDRTAEFVSDNLGTVLPIALLAIFVPTSVSTNLAAVANDAGPAAKMGLGVAQIVLALVSIWAQMALIALALELTSDREARAVALRRIPAVVVISIVCALIGMVLVVPIGVILVAAGVPVQNGTIAPGSIPFGAGLAVVGYATFLLGLTLWLGARLIVLVPVIVSENSWFGAFARSFRLTRGSTLKIVGVIILYVIVLLVAVLAAQAVFGSIFRLVAGGGEAMSLSAVLTSIVVAAVQTAFSVLSAVFTARLYQALALKHAGVRA